MRTLSSSLLTAATKWGSRPTVLADVQNKRWRWTTLHSHDEAANLSAQVALPYTTPTLITRALVDASGNLFSLKIADPAVAAQWDTWGAALLTNAIHAGDVAIAAPDLTSAVKLRLFFFSDLAGHSELKWKESSNGGTSWGAAYILNTALAATYLAASYKLYLTMDTGVIVGETSDWGGLWSAITPWTALTTECPTLATTLHGIACAWDNAAGLYRVVVAAAKSATTGSAIYIGTYDPTLDTWSAPAQIAPGGRGPAPSATVLCEPSISIFTHGTTTRYALSWVEAITGTDLTWTYPIAVWSEDYVHFGDETAISMGATTHRRANLTYWPTTKTLFVANELSVAKSVCWASANTDLNVSDLTVESYERDTRPLGSHLTISLVNPNPPSLRAPVRNNLTNAAAIDGIYDAAGRTGAYACVYPLSVLLLNRGYITGGYEEREALDPYYLTSIEVTKGQGSGPNAASSLILHAVDGWGLLDLWRPAETLTWVNQTVEWLCLELCQRVGLAFTHGVNSAFTRAIPLFTVSPMSTAATAIQQLLFLAGAVAYFTEAGAMHAVNLFGYAPTARVYLGGHNEILQASLSLRPYVATASRIYGNATGANAENDIQSMTLGLRLKRYIEDARLSVAAQAEDVADYLWRIQELSERSERVTVPMRPDPELYDTASLHVAIGVIPRSDDLRQIVAIRERYDASQQLAHTTLEMRRA
jgi:hypothetical protein